MGIAGHILGPRKLRKLSTLTGLALTRAYIRNHHAEGIVVIGDGKHAHYAIDPETGQSEPIDIPQHWTSCRATSQETTMPRTLSASTTSSMAPTPPTTSRHQRIPAGE